MMEGDSSPGPRCQAEETDEKGGSRRLDVVQDQRHCGHCYVQAQGAAAGFQK